MRLLMIPVGIALCIGIFVALGLLILVGCVPGTRRLTDQGHSDLQGAINALSAFWDKL